MKTETFTVASHADGTLLSVLLAEPECAPKGLVQIVHGMAEYKERYLPFIQALTDAGYACLINDLRGHGDTAASSMDLGWFGENGAAAVVQDIHQLTMLFKAHFPDLPLCLFGHSMGSLAVRSYLHQYDSDINALIVCGCPCYNAATPIGLAFVRFLIRFRGAHAHSSTIENMVNGAFAREFASEGSRFAWINSDPKAVAAYEEDPKCGFLFTLNGYEALLSLMQSAYSRKNWKVTRPDLPVLFISGRDDPCKISLDKLQSAVSRIRKAGYSNVCLNVYENMRHEILQEPERKLVFRDVISFLEEEMHG